MCGPGAGKPSVGRAARGRSWRSGVEKHLSKKMKGHGEKQRDKQRHWSRGSDREPVRGQSSGNQRHAHGSNRAVAPRTVSGPEASEHPEHVSFARLYELQNWAPGAVTTADVEFRMWSFLCSSRHPTRFQTTRAGTFLDCSDLSGPSEMNSSGGSWLGSRLMHSPNRRNATIFSLQPQPFYTFCKI